MEDKFSAAGDDIGGVVPRTNHLYSHKSDITIYIHDGYFWSSHRHYI